MCAILAPTNCHVSFKALTRSFPNPKLASIQGHEFNVIQSFSNVKHPPPPLQRAVTGVRCSADQNMI